MTLLYTVFRAFGTGHECLRRGLIGSMARANSFGFCPRRDFAKKAKSRGGTLVTRAYNKDSTYSSNIQSVY